VLIPRATSCNDRLMKLPAIVQAARATEMTSFSLRESEVLSHALLTKYTCYRQEKPRINFMSSLYIDQKSLCLLSSRPLTQVTYAVMQPLVAQQMLG